MSSLLSPSSRSSSDSDDSVGFVDCDYVPPQKLWDTSIEFRKLEKAAKKLKVPHRIGMSSEGEMVLYLETDQKLPDVKPAPNSQTSTSNSYPEQSKIPEKAVKPPEKMKPYFQIIPITDEVVNWNVRKVSTYKILSKEGQDAAIPGPSTSYPGNIPLKTLVDGNGKDGNTTTESSTFIRVISGPKVPYLGPGRQPLTPPTNLTVKRNPVRNIFKSMTSKDNEEQLESLSDTTDTDYDTETDFETDMLLAAVCNKLEKLLEDGTETNLYSSMGFQADDSGDDAEKQQPCAPNALSEGAADVSTQTIPQFEVAAVTSNPTAANTRNTMKSFQSLLGSSSV